MIFPLLFHAIDCQLFFIVFFLTIIASIFCGITAGYKYFDLVSFIMPSSSFAGKNHNYVYHVLGCLQLNLHLLYPSVTRSNCHWLAKPCGDLSCIVGISYLLLIVRTTHKINLYFADLVLVLRFLSFCEL